MTFSHLATFFAFQIEGLGNIAFLANLVFAFQALLPADIRWVEV
jgi:hypothetical protein